MLQFGEYALFLPVSARMEEIIVDENILDGKRK